MKTGARLPRGIRWLGLMALGGVSLAVQAEEKIVLLTSWYAQAEQGGYYQAQATGLYKKYGLDVEIRSGGPQVNGMQLLLSKRADVIIGYDLQLLEGIQRGFQAKAIAAPFQYDPQGLLTHADVTSLQGLKDKTLLVSSSGQATWWPWLKAQYQLSDAQVRPYTFNIQPFVVDDAVAQQAYVSSEVFQVQKAGVKANFFLFSEHGYPPYGGILIARPDTIAERKAAMAKFVRASMEGWVSYLKDPAPGNALIKQDNPKMSDDLLAWGVTQIREHHLIDGGDAASQGWGTMTDGWVSYLKDPAPGNALIKQDNPKMTDDLLAWGVTQIREHHLIDGGDAASQGWGTMTDARWQKTRDFMVSAGLLAAATDWKQAYTTEFVQAMQVKP